MALATLTDLQTAIADHGLARTDITTAAINDMITLAENDILYGTYDPSGRPLTPVLRVNAMETKNEAFAVSGEYTNLPTDFLEMREVRLTSQSDWPTLKFVTPEAFDSTYGSSASGPAKVWTVVGSQIRIGPGASTSDVLTLIYYAKPTALVTTTTNWILTKYPNAYLYGALRYFAPYINATEMLAVWQPAFVSAVRGLIANEGRGQFGGTSMAVRAQGVTVI